MLGREQSDDRYMAAALELAKLGRGRTSPNPMVGTVVVRNGRTVGRGHHEVYGGPHAEVNALAEAGSDADGATLYVTLEPCCVWGKTPPCTSAIISAGIARVVLAIEDPNPDVSGRGIAALRNAGIEVVTGVLADAAAELNAAYARFRASGLPLVRLKLALSVDGRLAGGPTSERWVSCEASRDLVHGMRAEADAVMVGIGTVLADDPLLTDRRPSAVRQAARVVVDTDLRTPTDSSIAQTCGEVRTLIVSADDADEERADALTSLGATILAVPRGSGGLDLEAVLRAVSAAGLLDVLCEGGGRLATGLLSRGLVDRVSLFVAPRLYGADGVASIGALGSAGVRLTEPRWKCVGRDALLEAGVGRVSGTGEEEGSTEEERIVHGTG